MLNHLSLFKYQVGHEKEAGEEKEINRQLLACWYCMVRWWIG